jgi:hypothetical protein
MWGVYFEGVVDEGNREMGALIVLIFILWWTWEFTVREK